MMNSKSRITIPLYVITEFGIYFLSMQSTINRSTNALVAKTLVHLSIFVLAQINFARKKTIKLQGEEILLVVALIVLEKINEYIADINGEKLHSRLPSMSMELVSSLFLLGALSIVIGRQKMLEKRAALVAFVGSLVLAYEFYLHPHFAQYSVVYVITTLYYGIANALMQILCVRIDPATLFVFYPALSLLFCSEMRSSPGNISASAMKDDIRDNLLHIVALFAFSLTNTFCKFHLYSKSDVLLTIMPLKTVCLILIYFLEKYKAFK
ncbi:hypothetical protein ENBRE01_0450 [Enteropsectra breve]|nr:hypothetical protein ENBRE01_0450 [Enteropsectra breve]